MFFFSFTQLHKLFFSYKFVEEDDDKSCRLFFFPFLIGVCFKKRQQQVTIIIFFYDVSNSYCALEKNDNDKFIVDVFFF